MTYYVNTFTDAEGEIEIEADTHDIDEKSGRLELSSDDSVVAVFNDWRNFRCED